jgi:xanthine dehydrogenase molybdopterin-binding subunit B
VLEGAHFERKKGGRPTLLPVKVKISYRMASTSDAEATVLVDEGGNIAWDMTPTQVHGQFKVKIPALVWKALKAAISSGTVTSTRSTTLRLGSWLRRSLGTPDKVVS